MEKHKGFHFVSNKSVLDIRDAYLSSKDKYPELCPEYFYDQTKEKLDLKIDNGSLFWDELGKYISIFCKMGDPSLKLIMKNNDTTLDIYKNEGSEYHHIGFVGYDLFLN